MTAEIQQMSFADKCAAVIKVEGAIKGLGEKAAEIAGAKRDLEAQEAALRDAILAEMQADGVTSAEECGLVFAVQRKPQSLVVYNDLEIPEEFFKTERRLEKKKLADAIKEGRGIPGAALDNGGATLVIRAKGRN